MEFVHTMIFMSRWSGGKKEQRSTHSKEKIKYSKE